MQIAFARRVFDLINEEPERFSKALEAYSQGEVSLMSEMGVAWGENPVETSEVSRQAILFFSMSDNVSTVSTLLKYVVFPADLHSAIVSAASNGSLNCLKLLMPLHDLKEKDSFVLSQSVLRGQVEAVKMVLPFSDPTAKKFDAINTAASVGSVEMLGLLLPYCPDVRERSRFLATAAMNGRLDAVKYLIPLADPKAEESKAMKVALMSNHFDVVRELLPHSDVAAVRQSVSFRRGAERLAVLDSMIQERVLKKKASENFGVSNRSSGKGL